jgi:hypothetical protein
MFTQKLLALNLGFIIIVLLCAVYMISSPKPAETKEPTKLAVVWTSDDPNVANRVCLMYTHAARNQKWFDQVELVVWGPSAKLLSEDKELQQKVKAMMEDGVIVEACIACANAYGVSDDLRELGITVKGMGKPLTDFLKKDWKVLTF